MRAHPSRLRALSTLPMSAPAAVDELVRAADLGHVGTMVYGRSGDRFLDDPAYDDLFAAAAALHQPVFLHPQLPSRAVRGRVLPRLRPHRRAGPGHLRMGLLSVTSVDRLIFSTDYPFQQPAPEDISRFLDHFDTDADREKFCSGNAAALSGLSH